MLTIKTISQCFFWLLSIIAFIITMVFAYVHFFVNDKTLGVNYVADQLGIDIIKSSDLSLEEHNEYEERWFMEANYYSNENTNGIELQELNFNYFTNCNLLSENYRATGMQYIGDFETYFASSSDINNRVVEDFYYYDTTNGITWSGYNGNYGGVDTKLNRNESFIIKIDNRAFSIQLTGSYRTGWWIFGHDVYYDYGDVFASVFKTIKSNSQGFGDYYITVDLSQYFTIREYDVNSGKFKLDNVTDIIKNYAVLKFHYDKNGADNSSQSLFGKIECNSVYDTVNIPYWQARYVYTINEQNFSYRYSDIYDGYFVSLNLSTQNMINNLPRTKIIISLNLQSTYFVENELNVLGFDYNAFENFELYSVSIIGLPQTFYMLDKCLFDTDLQFLEYSSGIVFDISPTAFNSDYVGVVL